MRGKAQVVFKRRDRRPVWQAVLDFLWPRGGWVRAFEYVKHRVRRLPDTPEKIARGIWAGVFSAFTPFFGVHFLVAWLVGWLMRGNILAALLGTFFANPLTYVPIAATSLWFGHRIMGGRPPGGLEMSLGEKFAGAGNDLLHNIRAVFTPARADWHRLGLFYEDVFLPYLIGGIIPGIICATICYFLSVSLIRAYQNRRRKVLQAKLGQLRKKPENAS